LKKLFINFVFKTNSDIVIKNYNKINSSNYLVYSFGDDIDFYICGIEELGPRPKNFPNKFKINRVEQEIDLIYKILNLINQSDFIFCQGTKIKQLYYKCKKFGIREGYISKKITWMKIKQLRIPYSPSENQTQELVTSLNGLDGERNTHWTVLSRLFLELKLNMNLCVKNGHNLKPGIYEIKKIKRKKTNLFEFLN